ncbi:hypothetical protein [Pyxidicoccus caerfyrddinensis]|uniref:hypothetical protein n=1 Tax=Pyxidicoccus caerfyrddinensis TaxID=2709663 RepID=UPI0013DCC52B|nr:hypothetical protein [Pyxidicoccus caerfyrddinensis]
MTCPVTVPMDGLTYDCFPLDHVACRDEACVYLVLDGEPRLFQFAMPPVLDVGESGQARTRHAHHDRRQDWERVSVTGNLWVAIHYTPTSALPQTLRLRLERALRLRYRPPCGDR